MRKPLQGVRGFESCRDCAGNTDVGIGGSGREPPEFACMMGAFGSPNSIGMKPTESGVESSSASVIWIEMEAQPEQALEYVVCVNNDGYPASLELHKIYRVLPDDDAGKNGDLRVIDESGEDYLYPANYFAFITVPENVKASLLKAR